MPHTPLRDGQLWRARDGRVDDRFVTKVNEKTVYFIGRAVGPTHCTIEGFERWIERHRCRVVRRMVDFATKTIPW